jgi:hypothetical protein
MYWKPRKRENMKTHNNEEDEVREPYDFIVRYNSISTESGSEVFNAGST